MPAKRKASKTATNSSANLGLEAKLWWNADNIQTIALNAHLEQVV